MMRPATNADGATVRALVFEILREHGLEPDPPGTDADLADLRTFYREGWFAVQELNGQIIGSVGLLPMDDGVFELRKMYLRREHRGQGWGRMLLEGAMAEARSMGARKIVLGTAAVLVEAVALYDQFGFRKSDDNHPAARCDQAWELDLNAG